MQGPLSAIDPSTIAATIEANINAYRLSVAHLPDAILHDSPESSWVDCGFPDATLNAVVRARFGPDAVDAGIASVLSHFRQRSSPVGWYVGPCTEPADLGRHLLAHGLTHDEDEPGMAIRIDRMREDRDSGAPSGLTIETVRDEAGLADWVSVWLFPVPDDVRRLHLDVLRRKGLGDALPWRYYVGRLDGVPVATSQLFVGESVAAVHLVVTLPEVRRRGIGTAMTRHVLREAHTLGYRVGVLTASPFGIGSYRRIGFRTYCLFSRYEWAPGPE